MEQQREVVVVVPTIREDSIRAFLAAWRDGLARADILVIEDNPEPGFDLGDHGNVTHWSWLDIERELGERAWIIPAAPTVSAVSATC